MFISEHKLKSQLEAAWRAGYLEGDKSTQPDVCDLSWRTDVERVVAAGLRNYSAKLVVPEDLLGSIHISHLLEAFYRATGGELTLCNRTDVIKGLCGALSELGIYSIPQDREDLIIGATVSAPCDNSEFREATFI